MVRLLIRSCEDAKAWFLVMRETQNGLMRPRFSECLIRQNEDRIQREEAKR
jgi:hypothetical protein